MSILRKTLSASACLLAWTAALALAAHGKKKAGFEGYGLVQTRNIFDPERLPGVVNTPAPEQSPPPTAADYAALTGTLLTADKALAFFSGSRPEFNQVLSTRGKIAEATLTQITPDSIEVERNGKRITIAIGQTVPLDASSTPGLAPAFIPSAPSAFSPPASATPSTSAAPAPGSADREAVMRRMMEKRQQELK